MQNYHNCNDYGQPPRQRIPAGKKRRKKNNIPMLFFVLFLVLATVLIVLLFLGEKSNIKTPDQSAEFDVQTPNTLNAENTESPVTTVGLPAFLTNPVTTAAPVTDPPIPSTGNPNHRYPFSYKVGQSAAVDDSFFSDAVFIGDSRMKGMMLFGTIKCDWYATESLHISSVDTTKFYTVGNKDYSAIDMLRMNADKYKKVYIGLGINDLGYAPANFVTYYRKTVDTIKEIIPDADIYAMAILPVSKERSDKAIYGVTNEKVAQFNQALSSMAEGIDRVYMLDVAEVFWSANGSLIDGTGSNDGVHLGASGYAIECDYIKTHTVK